MRWGVGKKHQGRSIWHGSQAATGANRIRHLRVALRIEAKASAFVNWDLLFVTFRS